MKLQQKFEYRRNLPHLQKADRPHFITFNTHKHFQLHPRERDIVFLTCLYYDEVKLELHAVVVMPDHVHRVCTFLRGLNGDIHPFAEVLNSIKGFTAHSVNRQLGRKGHLWQDESFDHVLRHEESLARKIEYVKQNPVEAGLVAKADEYPWLWADDMVDWSFVRTAEDGCATRTLNQLLAWSNRQSF
ncbi:MAG: transposase [Acidobacteriales bacterium]|nr:transposase [Terriglobales bacterium]